MSDIFSKIFQDFSSFSKIFYTQIDYRLIFRFILYVYIIIKFFHLFFTELDAKRNLKSICEFRKEVDMIQKEAILDIVLTFCLEYFY